MAFKTLRTYVGDGVATMYSIDFQLGYINRDYVYVYLTTDDYTTQVEYTWLNASQIEITTAVADGVSFNIRRVVPRDRVVNDYTDGAILREVNLDNSFKQALMWLEEVADGFMSEDEWRVQTDLNMLGHRIIGVGTATDVKDAAPLEQIQDIVDKKFDVLLGTEFVDYGRVSQTTSFYEDYGLITDTANIEKDYGSV
jgi:hypothetical protein